MPVAAIGLQLNCCLTRRRQGQVRSCVQAILDLTHPRGLNGPALHRLAFCQTLFHSSQELPQWLIVYPANHFLRCSRSVHVYLSLIHI